MAELSAQALLDSLPSDAPGGALRRERLLAAHAELRQGYGLGSSTIATSPAQPHTISTTAAVAAVAAAAAGGNGSTSERAPSTTLLGAVGSVHVQYGEDGQRTRISSSVAHSWWGGAALGGLQGVLKEGRLDDASAHRLTLQTRTKV